MFSRLVARLQDKGHNAKVANKCNENAAKVEMFGEYSNKSELHPRGTRRDSVRLAILPEHFVLPYTMPRN